MKKTVGVKKLYEMCSARHNLFSTLNQHEVNHILLSLLPPNSVVINLKIIYSKMIYLRSKQKKCSGGRKLSQFFENLKSTYTIEYYIPENEQSHSLQQCHAQVQKLQQEVYDLSNKITASKRKSKTVASSPKSTRSVRRMKNRIRTSLKEATGENYELVKCQSPRKTSLLLDDANLSLRKYQKLKNLHQPSVSKIRNIRQKVNDVCTDKKKLLAVLCDKCNDTECTVKISCDGHNVNKGSAVTFTASLVDGTQSSDRVVVLQSIKGSENYDVIKEAAVWPAIEQCLPDQINGKVIKYFFCADLKSLLLNLGYKDSNGRDVCIYCSCDKARWHLCCQDEKCKPCYNQSKNKIALPSLQPSDPGYKRKPLIDIGKYKFVIVDTLHAYLRITDQLFSRTVCAMSKKNVSVFLNECGTAGIPGFKLHDAVHGFKFSLLNVHQRKLLISKIFVRDEILKKFLSADTVAPITRIFKLFVDLWASVKDADIESMSNLIPQFTSAFRKTFARSEIPNYIHILSHFPFLFQQFGNINVFQQQSVEKMNRTIVTKFFTVSPYNLKHAVTSNNRKFFYYS
ncbi:Uncharacterised protein g9939 [Pycnogonum litorale]